jgi:hypothetical protein
VNASPNLQFVEPPSADHGAAENQPMGSPRGPRARPSRARPRSICGRARRRSLVWRIGSIR